MRTGLVAAIVVGLAAPARVHAEPTDHDRAVDTGLLAGMGVAYLVVELVFKRELAAVNCRWCNPNAFDDAAHVSKFAFARQRPFVHFGPPGRAFDDNDNTSAWSGHTCDAVVTPTGNGLAIAGAF